MANKTYNDVQVRVKFKAADSRTAITTGTAYTNENIALTLGKIGKWYDALVPTGGSEGKVLAWNTSGTAKWSDVPDHTHPYLPLAGGTLTGRVTTSKALNYIIKGTGTAGADKGSGQNPRYVPAKWTFNTGQTPTDGDIIFIKIPVAGHDYGVYISIDNGTTYYPAVVSGSSRLTTHYTNGNYAAFTFRSDGSAASMIPLAGNTDGTRVTVSGGVWQGIDYYDSGNNYDRTSQQTRIYAGGVGVFRYSICGINSAQRMESFTTTGDANGSPTTTKTFNTSAKFSYPPVLMYNSANAVYANGNAIGNNVLYEQYPSIDMRYSCNKTSSASTGFAQYKPVFIECTFDDNGFWSITSNGFVQTFTSGNYYILVGCMYSTSVYQLAIFAQHPVYYYDGTNLTMVPFTKAEKTKLAGITEGATKTEASSTNGNIKINGSDVTVYTHPTKTQSDTTSSASPAHGGTFTVVDSVTRDTNGHVSGINVKTVTLPNDQNTDTKVTQSLKSDDVNRPLLMGYSNITTTTIDVTNTSMRNNSIYANAYSGRLFSNGYTSNGGNIVLYTSGTAATPKLVFQRADAGDNYLDWAVYGNSGYLYFDRTTSGSTSYETIFKIDPTNGSTLKGDLSLISSSGDSPALIFQRGTLTDSLNDWKIYVSSGGLYFAQSTANASTATWTNKMYFHASDGNLYVGNTKVSLEGHTHNYVPNTSAGVSAAINLLTTGASNPTLDDYYIAQYAGGGTTTTSYHRRPISALWNTFKALITVATTGSGNAITSAEISNDGNNRKITFTKGSTFLTSHQTVTDGNPTLAWGTQSTVATIGSTDVHVTMPTNPVPSNNITGSGTSGYLAKFNGTNTITNGPQLGSSTTTFLRNDGTWATPTDTDTKVNVTLATTTKAYLLATSTTPTATAQAVTSIADTGVYLGTTAGSLCATTVQASSTVCANTANSNTAGGISLYSTDPGTYGIMFRGTANSGKHGYVQSDWATYFTMNDGGTTRGWIFRRGTTNVGSVSGEGHAVFNGSVTVGGNTTNASGCRMVYTSDTQSLDFVFV